MLFTSSFTQKSGMGNPVFSRQGKLTVNQYRCFTQNPEDKHEVVQKPKEKSPVFMPLKEIEERMRKLDLELEENDKNSNLTKPTSSFTCVNRENTQTAIRNRSISPPIGRYSPCYNALDRNITGPIYSNEKAEVRFRSESTSPKKSRHLKSKVAFTEDDIDKKLNITLGGMDSPIPQIRTEASSPTKDKRNLSFMGTKRSDRDFSANASPGRERVYGHTSSPIQFSRQKSREPFVDPNKGPHERRFESINLLPSISSKYHNYSPPKLGKYSDRVNSVIVPNMNLIDYDVKIDIVREKVVVRVPKFEKCTNRPGPEIKKCFEVPNNIYNPEKAYEANKFKNSPTLIPMNKTMARDDRMYRISEGYNLKPKEDTIRRILETSYINSSDF